MAIDAFVSIYRHSVVQIPLLPPGARLQVIESSILHTNRKKNPAFRNSHWKIVAQGCVIKMPVS